MPVLRAMAGLAETRGPGDALLFGTTLAQSLGSVSLPDWKPGTMLPGEPWLPPVGVIPFGPAKYGTFAWRWTNSARAVMNWFGM